MRLTCPFAVARVITVHSEQVEVAQHCYMIRKGVREEIRVNNVCDIVIGEISSVVPTIKVCLFSPLPLIN